jgi:secreted PhoX family phosphatase
MNATTQFDRKRFLQSSAAVGGGLAIGGPLSALAAREARGNHSRAGVGYGPIQPTPEEGTGKVFLALPAGFSYRVISRENDPSTAFVTENGRTVRRDDVPTPGIFDGMGSFRGDDGATILVRNHENRQRDGEKPVIVPDELRYDPNSRFTAGDTRLVVDEQRNVVGQAVHVLGGTSTNCAGGETPWGTWITCEETFVEESATERKHGYCFEVDASSEEPVDAVAIKAAGAFSHEAVAFLDDILYETEDRGDMSGFYRYVPDREPEAFGDLARSEGRLQSIRRRDERNFDADTARMGESFQVDWVTIEDPDPETDTVRSQGQAKGAIAFARCEGCWEGDGKIYFDCTEGGSAEKGQLWEYDPRRRRLTLLYVSTGSQSLENPDNVVYVPATGDIFLQEDGPGEQFVRGVTQEGEIYDFAMSILNETEFCGGCFSSDGETFFLNQQGERGVDSADLDEMGGLTYAIWGPFARTARERAELVRNEAHERRDQLRAEADELRREARARARGLRDEARERRDEIRAKARG